VQDSEKAKMMNAICGHKCVEQLEKLPRVSSWEKTFAALLTGTGEWYSTKCVLIWKILVIKSRPFLYLHARQMPLTNANEFGLLPTTQARDWKGAQGRGYKGTAQDLPTKVMLGLIPTPNAFDWNTPRKAETFRQTQKHYAKKGINLHNPLRQMAEMGMLPTPTAHHHNAGTARPRKNGKSRADELNHLVSIQVGKSSQLNPRFVAEMMGFPVNWTELPFQSGENNP
jgi:hypothetical protein